MVQRLFDRHGRRGALVGSILLCSACLHTDDPFLQPLSPVGGARPASPAGLHVLAHYGDGLLGRHRGGVTLGGLGVGLSAGDRVELGLTFSHVVEAGLESTDQPAGVVHAKVRLRDVWEGRGSVGIHVAHVSQGREGSVDEQMIGLDLALPVELHWQDLPAAFHSVGIYGAPRVLFHSIRNRESGKRLDGTASGGLIGLVARWRYLTFSGELNLLETQGLRGGGSGWTLFPVAGARLTVPLGD